MNDTITFKLLATLRASYEANFSTVMTSAVNTAKIENTPESLYKAFKRAEEAREALNYLLTASELASTSDRSTLTHEECRQVEEHIQNYISQLFASFETLDVLLKEHVA